MIRLLDFARDYLLPRREPSAHAGRPDLGRGLVVTGDGLVESILEAIRIRRSVLVTGPRGCGKTWCVKQAIKRAYDAGEIGGWHFLQGNREIPRDYISEDMLIINREGQPELVDALAIRSPNTTLARKRIAAIRTARGPKGPDGARPVPFPSWPAIPAITLHELRRERGEQWTPWGRKTDWVVLFLDEINRFGDGFLDSLLSLTEEGIIVRGGDEYHVPVVVMATANPPGYDVTAKKLSPPLQARIGRSYRVSQPPLDHLVNVILPSKEEMFGAALGQTVALREREKYLASAATLCLWGDPDHGLRGAAFLTSGTCHLLRRAMRLSIRVKQAMTDLSDLIQFGPDARAVGEWIGAAAAQAQQDRSFEVKAAHLIKTAGAVLGHKLRESFNEGSHPEKVAQLQRCIQDIVSTVLTKPVYEQLFVLPYQAAADRLKMGRSMLLARLSALEDESRWHPWLRALADLPDEPGEAAVEGWFGRHRSDREEVRAFTRAGSFFNHDERDWLMRTMLADVPKQAPSDAGTARPHLLAYLAGRPLTSGESSARHRLEQTTYAALFADLLLDVARRNEPFLASLANGQVQREWIDAVERVIDPHGGEVSALIDEAKQRFANLGCDPQQAVKVMSDALRVVSGSGPVSSDYRLRADSGLRLLEER
ncbi:MAG TPA: hypothetical protein VFA20_32820 [Myxococcaceae bacterium]|nr:hypothetical protein [Myxococcaceae bacterium]